MKNTIIAIALFLGAVNGSAQTTILIPASADNTIYQSPSGSSNAIGENLFSGTNGGGSTRRCLIKFDIAAAIPAGALITQATLTLNCNTSRSIADDISLHKLLSNWGEGTSNAGAAGDGSGIAATTNDATWLANFFNISLWTLPGGDFTATPSATQSINAVGFYSWNNAGMLPDIQAWLNNPATNFGWIMRCNESTASTARKFASRENSVPANRPVLSITYTTVLPVTLISFKATERNGSALLQWETSTEINNRHFRIMHSSDGISFSQLALQNSQGAGTGIQRYEFVHVEPSVGFHYYKLIQVDIDGSEKNSPIEKLKIGSRSVNISMSPNPVQHQITVSGVHDLEHTVYIITDANGRIVQKNKSSAVIPIASLSAGVYQVSFYKGLEWIGTKRFLKAQ